MNSKINKILMTTFILTLILPISTKVSAFADSYEVNADSKIVEYVNNNGGSMNGYHDTINGEWIFCVGKGWGFTKYATYSPTHDSRVATRYPSGNGTVLETDPSPEFKYTDKVDEDNGERIAYSMRYNKESEFTISKDQNAEYQDLAYVLAFGKDNYGDRDQAHAIWSTCINERFR